jgi:hypothetical protein
LPVVETAKFCGERSRSVDVLVLGVDLAEKGLAAIGTPFVPSPGFASPNSGPQPAQMPFFIVDDQVVFTLSSRCNAAGHQEEIAFEQCPQQAKQRIEILASCRCGWAVL